MKKSIKKSKSNLLFLLIGILIGSSVIVLADTINSNEVLYDNSSSGSGSTDVQGALDNLFDAVNHSGTGYSIITHNPQGISTQLLGGLYRYQGTNPSNYICFGTTDKNLCTSDTGNYMYRIIGINETGQLKLIKYSSIGNYSWHSVGTVDTSWPNSDLFKKINGLDASNNYFLNTQLVPSEWENRIATTTWKYGDISTVDYSTVYNIENNFSNSVDAKIGIMYIHDYYYANCGTSECNDSVYKSGWLYSNYEHLITRYGYGGSYHSKNYLVYYLNPSGGIGYGSYNSVAAGRMMYESPVHPVFYLSLNESISSGTGTITDPYILN